MPRPHGFDQPRVGLDEVVCTEELRRRPYRPPDHAAENRALAALAETMARAPGTLLQELVETSRDLCRADSAGVSILEPGGDREAFRWHAIAGPLRVNAGRGMPRDASPCGAVLDRDATLLFARPERHFTFPVSVGPPVVESLTVPFHAGGEPVGTVWVIAHTEDRRFDAEDARLLESLSRFAAAAYQMIAALDAAGAARAGLERRVAERTRELSDANAATREGEALLAAELSAVRRLQQLSTRLVDCESLPRALEEVLDATIALLGADMGSVQLYDPRRRVLTIAAARGFGQDLLDRFREVDVEAVTASARALRGEATVVIEDVEGDPGYEPLRPVAASAGYRAVLSAPLPARGGGLLGIVSTHFRRPHRPADRDRRMLELYVRMATGFIERLRSEEALRASEERFRLLVENVRDYAILFLDPGGRVSGWNEGAERLLGYRAEDALGRPSDRFFTPEDRDRGLPRREMEQAAATGRAGEENWMVRADGTRLWASGSLTALRDAAGGLRGFVKIFRDLTDRRRVEDALRESEEKYRTLFTSIDEGVALCQIIVDGSGRPVDYRLLEVNPAVERMAGITPEAARGATARGLVPAIEDSWVEIYGRAALHGEAIRFEKRMEGLNRWFDAFACPLGAGRDGRFVVVFKDVTRRKQAEDALRASEARFRALVNASSYVVYRMNPDWTELRLLGGRGTAPDAGGPRVDWLGEYILPEDQPRVLEAVREAVRAKGVFELEHRVRRADGTLGWTLSRAVPLLDADGEVVEWVGAASDVTARKQAEEALRQGEARLQLALSAARMGVWTWDVAADVQSRDPNLNRLLGLEAVETRQPCGEFLARAHPGDRAAVAAALEASVKRGRPLHVEFRIIRPGGAVRWLRSQGGACSGPDGVTPHMAGACVDITDLKEAEEALRRARDELEDRVCERTAELARANESLMAEARERQRAEAARTQLLRELATTEERERQRISRELHDQLGQHCASLIIGMTTLQPSLPVGSGAGVQFERLVQLARRLDDDLHRIALELRPTALDDLGLDETLLNLSEEWGARAQVVVDYSSQGLGRRRLPPEVETAVYRIVQEALTNVQKHAAAGRVGLILRRREDHLVVIVEDDGIGFVPEKAVEAAEAAGRLGMRGMRERAALVGGDLEVESAPGRGTTVFVRIPLRPGAGAPTDG